MQIDIYCLTCWHWSCVIQGCTVRNTPGDCKEYMREYICPGGMVRCEQVTEEDCRECAKQYTGCAHMAVAFGYVERSQVANLLRTEMFPCQGYSKDWRRGTNENQTRERA